jgi:predicted component of type VI protein secretion system
VTLVGDPNVTPYEVQISRSRKAYATVTSDIGGHRVKPRRVLTSACDDYRAVLRNAKPGTKVRLRNTLTGKTLASFEVASA